MVVTLGQKLLGGNCCTRNKQKKMVLKSIDPKTIRLDVFQAFFGLQMSGGHFRGPMRHTHCSSIAIQLNFFILFLLVSQYLPPPFSHSQFHSTLPWDQNEERIVFYYKSLTSLF